ncbi:MAG TPA: DUF2330 domain-containing protein [Polyangiaceae bacterium]
MKRTLKSFVLGGAVLTAVLGGSSPADACGGFFCSAAQPVNQAAEHIIFADNGDGTVTAVIEIMYEGPSENFSWLLPISSVPTGDQIAVASDIAFQRLQAVTNPQYGLTTRVEGTCKQQGFAGSSGSAGSNAGGPVGAGGTGGTGGPGPGVVVEASGVVGAFEWTAISLDPDLDDPADVAVAWLGDNGYDVPEGSSALLGPYLEDGLYLLALRLTKGADVGAIRPIVLTYEADKPMIPVKLTAVAANDDMGVMAFLLSDSRAVPLNYLSLELNEARINWFNASQNYEQTVIDAADDANGQGFVTEFSGSTGTLASAVWTQSDDVIWENYSTGVHSSFQELFSTAYYQWGQWDGFWEAVEGAVTLPDGVAFADFKVCPNCYAADITVAPATFVTALEEGVIEPVRLVQDLIDAHPTLTRLYTTLSAEEMTVDPLFTFNPDLPEVSNIHTAERIIECTPDVYQFEANWRIELPQGGVIRGTPSDVGTWPAELGELPANLRIRQVSDTGEGNLLEDNADDINALLADYNDTVPAPVGSGGEGNQTGTGGNRSSGGSSNAGRGGVGTSGTGTSGSSNGTGGTRNGEAGAETGEAGEPGEPSTTDGGCSCKVAGSNADSAGAFAFLGLLGLSVVRRRRR